MAEYPDIEDIMSPPWNEQQGTAANTSSTDDLTSPPGYAFFELAEPYAFGVGFPYDAETCAVPSFHIPYASERSIVTRTGNYESPSDVQGEGAVLDCLDFVPVPCSESPASRALLVLSEASSAPTISPEITAAIVIAASSAPDVSGSQGSNFSEISSRTGALVLLNNHQSDSNLNTIEISGSFDQTLDASRMVGELIKKNAPTV